MVGVSMVEVYPRVCGGTRPADNVANWADGLSPRVRGNQDVELMDWDGWGSIPACAGEPEPGTGLAAARTVYPRVCGGTIAAGRDGSA